MVTLRPFQFLILCFLIGWSIGKKPLNVHLRVVPIEGIEVLTLIKDANKTVIGATGLAFHIMEWLSKSLGFTYSFIAVEKLTYFSNTAKKRGAQSYLDNGEADFALGVVLMSEGRNKVADLTHPWSMSPLALLVPIVETSSGISAPWNTFQYPIWILIILGLLLIPTCLYYSDLISSENSYFTSIEMAIRYAYMVLLNQCTKCGSKNRVTIFVAGLWGVSCFMLANSYRSRLVSFLTSSNQEPLLDSIYDLPNKPKVHLVVEEGAGPDIMFSSADRGILKYVGQDLNAHPYLRCHQTSDCIKQVKLGNHAFVNPQSALFAYLRQDFNKTGRCTMTVSKEGFMNALLAFALPLRSPAVRSFNLELIRLEEVGLKTAWRKFNMNTPEQCRKLQKTTQNRPLTFRNLQSTFAVLIIGLVISILVFVIELLIARYPWMKTFIFRNREINIMMK